MELTLTTPALLFPAISLLLLAYTNRFLTLANLIRSLQGRYNKEQDENIVTQIENLRQRVVLIKQMQLYGIASLLLCVIDMFILFAGFPETGKWIFGISLVLLMISLTLSIREIQISVRALQVQLSDMDGISFKTTFRERFKTGL